jgi:hypothetical protein
VLTRTPDTPAQEPKPGNGRNKHGFVVVPDLVPPPVVSQPTIVQPTPPQPPTIQQPVAAQAAVQQAVQTTSTLAADVNTAVASQIDAVKARVQATLQATGVLGGSGN